LAGLPAAKAQSGKLPILFFSEREGIAGHGFAFPKIYGMKTNGSNQTRIGDFGFGTDLPVPADYDGDGKADIAVFRDGTWYLQRSQAGFTGVAFGNATDKPVPNAFVP
ncbi:MAG: hypothetical protein WKF90_14625, partial [Pyrinomonadaceae bacterium]